jgi:Fic family protein
MSDNNRHSVAESPSLITDEDEKARREAENGLRQFDLTVQMILSWVESADRTFRLRPSAIQQLQRAALDGLSSFAGNWRPGKVEIRGSKHQPADAFMVAEQVEELCDYVNEHWSSETAIHLASYVLWRLNWIHPFDDGNGRTSRAVSYLVLCTKLGYLLPGTNTIPDQIAADRPSYYDALELADEPWEQDQKVDVSALEQLLSNMLAKQLLSVMKDATGQDMSEST